MRVDMLEVVGDMEILEVFDGGCGSGGDFRAFIHFNHLSGYQYALSGGCVGGWR